MAVIGTGTGLVSIVLSLALKRIASLERNIIATDLGKSALTCAYIHGLLLIMLKNLPYLSWTKTSLSTI